MNRQSNVRRVVTSEGQTPDTIFVVDMYENGVLVESRELPNKSIHYANDVAENWKNGIIQQLNG